MLDSGGEAALTLRAVGHAAGVSHNAPYKHFKNRDALLAAVAIADLSLFAGGFRDIRRSNAKPRARLKRALDAVLAFSKDHPARYHLIFSNPGIAALEGELKRVATETFGEFAAIIEDCQAAGQLPAAPSAPLASLLFATLHGLVLAEATGRMHAEKGLTSVSSGLELLIALLSPVS